MSIARKQLKNTIKFCVMLLLSIHTIIPNSLNVVKAETALAGYGPVSQSRFDAHGWQEHYASSFRSSFFTNMAWDSPWTIISRGHTSVPTYNPWTTELSRTLWWPSPGTRAFHIWMSLTTPDNLLLQTTISGVDLPETHTIAAGDVVNLTVWAGPVSPHSVTVTRNGVPLAAANYIPPPIITYDTRNWLILKTQKMQQVYYNPTLDWAFDQSYDVGESTHWTGHIRASWGLSNSNKIPGKGQITNTSLVGGTDPDLSTDGLVFDGIGVKVHHFSIKDDHSLSMEAQYAGDNTELVTSRTIRVYLDDEPDMKITYGSSAVDANGIPISSGTVYSATDVLTTSGGEDGWTNQPLDVELSPNVRGLFDAVVEINYPEIRTVETQTNVNITSYHTESPTLSGVDVEGVLTEIANRAQVLSHRTYAKMKIDKTSPIAGATHDGGFTFTDTSSDVLSGLSVINPSLIAIVPVGTVPITTDYILFEDIVPLPQGTYDVHVLATDKAGNVHIEKVFSNYALGGEVTISKDTDEGATLHKYDCLSPHNELPTLDTTCIILGCSLGMNVDIMELFDLTYKIGLNNTSVTEDGTGNFVDYLPKGCTIVSAPTFTGSDPIDDITFTYGAPESSGPYEGQIKVTGTYMIKAGSTIDIEITCKVPAFDNTPTGTNIISNQAALDWTIGTGVTAITGSSESNYANHKIKPPSVKSQFTKVAAENINTTISGAEFVLYKWTGTDVEYTTGNHDSDIVDKENLLDGKWQRVKKDGEDALFLADIFTSDGSGIVDFGNLPSGIYTLIETKTAPTYEIPVGQWIITVDATKSDSGTAGEWKIEFVGKSNSIMPPAVARVGGGLGIAPEYKILNAKPFVIGLTGLGGTTSFLIIGISLMLFASGTYTVISHKKKKEMSQ